MGASSMAEIDVSANFTLSTSDGRAAVSTPESVPSTQFATQARVPPAVSAMPPPPRERDPGRLGGPEHFRTSPRDPPVAARCRGRGDPHQTAPSLL